VAKKFCDGHCYADGSKCGVNSFSVIGECRIVLPTTSNSSVSTGILKEVCGGENEKVNRDPLAGPTNTQCCYGLKEDRASKYYSVCIKPLDNSVSDLPVISGASSSGGSAGMANPASIFCISKGYKNVIRNNADGSQYGVCIFNNGSECDEWKFYRGECKEGGSSGLVPSTGTTVVNPVSPTTGSGSGSSVVPSTSNTNTYSY
jgi:putative hemolysin